MPAVGCSAGPICWPAQTRPSDGCGCGHSLEETGHKAVACDVWNQAVGAGTLPYVIRSGAMALTSMPFWLLVAEFSVRMIEHDPETRCQPLAYLDLLRFLFGQQGMFAASLPTWMNDFKPSFHPWQHDNRQLLERIDTLSSDREAAWWGASVLAA